MKGTTLNVEKLLLTAEETGHVLGFGRTKMYDLIRRGEITSIKVGGRRRIPVSAVQRFVDTYVDDQPIA